MMFAADHPDIHVIVTDSSKEFVGTAAFELVRQRDRAIRHDWRRARPGSRPGRSGPTSIRIWPGRR
ncbi:MAG: hypothetical protein R2755_21005 [Acidimicrobiales bacterium]